MEIITSSTFPSESINYNKFRKMVSGFDYISSLMKLQDFSALMNNKTDVKIPVEITPPGSPFKITDEILIARHAVSFIAKTVILNCKRSSNKLDDATLSQLAHHYESLESDLSTINPKAKDSWLLALRIINLQHFYLRIPITIIARYYFIFSSLLENNTELAKILNESIKLDLMDVFKIGFCIYASLTQNKFFDRKNLTDNSISCLKSLLTSEKIDKFLDLFSANQEEFKSKFKEFKVDDFLLKKYEFNPLKRFPILKTNSKIEKEKYIIPSIPDFIYSFSEGLYYALIDRLNNSQKNNLFMGIGGIFEEYVGSLLKYYNAELLPNSKLFKEIEYTIGKNRIKSADWLLVSDKYIFQIECKKRKLDNYSKAGMNGENSGIKTLIESIAEELDKLENKKEHIKNNVLNGIEFKDQKIISILVYLDEMFAINQYARKAILEYMKASITDFHILGCLDFEVACQECRDKNKDLYQAILNLDDNKIYKVDFLSETFSNFKNSLEKT